MYLLAYSVFDAKAGVYSHPFFCVSDGVAKRSFIDAVMQEGHAFNLHAEDFSLCAIGGFNDNDGKLGMVTGMPTVMMTAVQAKAIGSGSVRMVVDNTKEEKEIV